MQRIGSDADNEEYSIGTLTIHKVFFERPMIHNKDGKFYRFMPKSSQCEIRYNNNL